MGFLDSIKAAFSSPATAKLPPPPAPAAKLPPPPAGAAPLPPPPTATEVEWLPLTDTVPVVGTSHRQDVLKHLGEWTKSGGLSDRYHEGLIEFEPSNPHDSKAIKITVDGLLIGYIAKSDHKWMAPKLRKVNGVARTEVVLIGGQEKKIIGAYLR